MHAYMLQQQANRVQNTIRLTPYPVNNATAIASGCKRQHLARALSSRRFKSRTVTAGSAFIAYGSRHTTYTSRIRLYSSRSEAWDATNRANTSISSNRSKSSKQHHSSGPRRIVPVMVEGHQCHRVGAAHRRLLVGKAFKATSPNGRFIDGAAAITGKLLTRIEIHGKNLFYFFTGSSSGTGSSAGGSSTSDPAANNNQSNVILTAADIDPLAEPDESLAVPEAGVGPQVTTAAVSPEVPSISPHTPAQPSRSNSATTADNTTNTSGILRSLGAAAAAALAAASPATPAAAATMSTAAAAAAATNTPSSTNVQQQSNPSDTVVVHIHFGMSGAFRTALMPGPEATPTTRLRLEHQPSGLMAHLSAMTVAHGGPELYQEKVSKLGPDPLRPDDDPERFWLRVNSSKKPIGLLLMDQSAVAGVGNIYRAEILYKSRLHPEQPGYSLTREQFDVLWGHCVECLQRGFTSGSILTVDPEDARTLGKPWTRRYIYNQRMCGRCRGPVRSWDMAGRTVYCCETCQPLQLNISAAPPKVKRKNAATAAAAAAGDGDGSSDQEAAAAAAAAEGIVLSPARLKSMAAAKQAKEFVSHCAPDDPSDLQPAKMTVTQLKQHLISLNLNTRGKKNELVERLEQALKWAAATDQDPAAAAAGLGQVAAAAAGSSGSEDEVDRAEDKLAENLSVPAAKRRRKAAATAAAAAAATDPAGSSDVPVTPDPPKRRRRTAAAAANPAAAAAGGDAAAMASASAAAAEKEAAGENRAVEHVALHADDVTEAMMFGSEVEWQQQQQQSLQQQQQQQQQQQGLQQQQQQQQGSEGGVAVNGSRRRTRKTGT